MVRRIRATASALAAAMTLSGCGLLPAVKASGAGGLEARSLTQTSTNEVPTPVSPKEQIGGAGSLTPEQALRQFATAYINWSATDVGPRLRALADQCVGQARSELQLAAAQVAVDTQLKAGGIGNRGTVEALARLRGSGDRYVVVTREQTLATASEAYAGLAPEWHLTIATVERAPTRMGRTRWAVSGWQPES